MQKKRLQEFYFVVAAILAFLLGLQSALADVEIFDGDALMGYKYNTSIGEGFTVTYAESTEKIIVDLDSESIIIRNKSCSAGSTFEGCYRSATFKGYNRSQPNPEVYSFNLRLTLLAPSVQVGKVIDKPEVDAGGEATVRVNITNSGSKPGTVYFSETVPGSLKIIELPDQPCELSTGNTLRLVAELKGGERKHCDYKVSSQEPGTYSLVSNANFETTKPEKSTASASLTVKPLPFSLNMTSRQQLILGEKVNMTFSLSPSDNLDSFVFTALIPSYLKSSVVTREAAGKTANNGFEVSYGNAVTSFNTSLDLKISSEATGVGIFIINAKASWLRNGLKQEINTEFPVNVTFAEPYLRLVKYDSETGKALVDIVNPAHLPISGVSAASGSFLPAGHSLDADQINSAGHASFEVVLAQSSGNYTSTISYRTGYGQRLNAVSTLPISAPAAKSIQAPQPQPAGNEQGNAAATPPATSPPQEEPVNEEKSPKPNRVAGLLGSIEVKIGAIMGVAIVAVVLIFERLRRRPTYA